MPDKQYSADEVLELLSHLLKDHKIKTEIVEDLNTASTQYPALKGIIDTIVDLRTLTSSLGKGQLDEDVKSRGFLISNLKALQSNLHHLVWQMTQISKGDFSQRVDFLGDFSDSFNAMCEQLEYQNSTLTELAQYDSLTKLANRQYLDQYLSTLFERTKMTGNSFALMMIDIDFFKKVNDNYGHDIGDAVLVAASQYFGEIFRSTDFVARYGGEEFIAVLPNVEIEQALVTAERARAYFDEHPIIINDDLVIQITISIGVSVFESSDHSFEETIKRSDNALYAAKRNGRNRVERG